ncbi:MAG: prephenate dehydrogenase/arogenate dehydrogenase family protein [Clostridia bacterium]|nr:prephenate dehydrogenase/arogenate dehydrogenase family protein [Clostridia bacterium]
MHINKIGIIGLGLIGGSMAKALKKYTDYSVTAYDIEPEIITSAVYDGTIDGEMLPEECDMIISALYPEATVSYLEKFCKRIKKGALVCDCGGTKRLVCDKCVPIAEKCGFKFVGAHPMAGTEHSGYGFSNADLFGGASLIICSAEKEPVMEEVFGKIGFKTFKYTTAENHDSVIAFTSQLAHVVSNAMVKSPEYPKHPGYSAGSLKDLTRVAWLNENMWTELFLENRDFLSAEIDGLIENLKKYSKAITSGDDVVLRELLREGRMIKEKIDGR